VKPITMADLATLPPTVDLMTAARVLGIGRTKAYDLAKHGTFPCYILRIGSSYRVSTTDLVCTLGAVLPGPHLQNEG
jgi:Helix-turn-helix domain